MSTWKPSGTPRNEQTATPIARSLSAELRRLGGPDTGVTAAIFAHWEDLVGEAIAQHCKPLSLRGGVLVVVADEAAWATQLRYLGAQIIARVVEVTGRNDIAELRVRMAGEEPPRPPR